MWIKKKQKLAIVSERSQTWHTGESMSGMRHLTLMASWCSSFSLFRKCGSQKDLKERSNPGGLFVSQTNKLQVWYFTGVQGIEEISQDKIIFVLAGGHSQSKKSIKHKHVFMINYLSKLSKEICCEQIGQKV